MLVKVFGSAVFGVEATTITVEVNIDKGVGYHLVGLPDNAMKDLNAEAELETLKNAFFDETNETEKKRLRNKINTKIRQLLDHAEQFAGYKIDFDFKLYFSEVWHYKNGFDIVIGNPPYVFTRDVDFSDDFKRVINENFISNPN